MILDAVDDVLETSQVIIHNVKIDIIGGGIISVYNFLGTYINIHNLFIQSNAINVDNTTALFTFSESDNVYLSQTTILYHYDATLHCEYLGDRSSYRLYTCKNPMMLINNMGQINKKI